MNRQQKRRAERTIRKKAGQLMAIHNEEAQGVSREKAHANHKNFMRLQNELMEMGAIKKPNLIQKAIGKIKATVKVGRYRR